MTTKRTKRGTEGAKGRGIFTAFLPYSGAATGTQTVEELKSSGLVARIVLLTAGDVKPIPGCITLKVRSMTSSATVRAIASKASSPYALWLLRETDIGFGQFALQRFAAVAEGTGAGLIYSDYYDIEDGRQIPHPVVEYQEGSIRDDFNFGAAIVLHSATMREAVHEPPEDKFLFAGLYALRLAITRKNGVIRIGEFLYTSGGGDRRKSGEKQFDYVDPGNRAVQIEMESAATAHLKRIGAFLTPVFRPVDLSEGDFPVQASVIIPVRDRASTIGDAVSSALRQLVPFGFNVIVVDNHSTDGTTALLRTFATRDPRVIHVIPGRRDLGIGGCWNEAVHHPSCGRFAVQLDSDDLYGDETTLGRIVEKFYKEKCAMVVGSYRMTNMSLEEIPPGIIDHREWTPENGRNNALRINGFGAPRAFFTPILRRLAVPNVSYGEDYAAALAISREYQLARIYEPLYLCRRWEGNSDANLTIEKLNTFNFYKDKIRTLEILARRRKVAAARGRAVAKRGRKDKGRKS